MPAKEILISVDAARADVLEAFAAMPTNAFEQVLAWMCPAPSRPLRLDAIIAIGFGPFRETVDSYFAAKRSV